jgi:hypothetical protein
MTMTRVYHDIKYNIIKSKTLKIMVSGDKDTNLTDSISNSLEPICRQILYVMHNKRYALLKST